MKPASQLILKNSPWEFLSGGGEMGKYVRSIDWSKTPIGNPSSWPQALQTAINICLNSPFPMNVLCGKDFVQIYNDAYRDTMGDKCIDAIGEKSENVWKENWPEIAPVLREVLKTGETILTKNRLVVLERDGHSVECYFTFSYSPVYNAETDSIDGIVCSVVETSKKVQVQNNLKNQLSDLFAEAPCGLSIYQGKNHIITVANQRMLEIWGRKKEEVIDKPVLEALPETANRGFEQLLDNVYNTGKRFIADNLSVSLLRNGNLETIFVKFVFEALRDDDGNIYAVVCLADEITEAKIKEAALLENEERLSHAVESGKLGTYEVDNKSGNVIFSRRLAEIFGLDPSKPMTHQDLKNAIHPHDIHIRRTARNKAKETGILFYEARVVWPDKSIHWVRFNGKIAFDHDGNALRTYGTAVDITDHKQAEAILRQSEQELRLIADAIPHMVWVIDPDGTISYINKQWADWTGMNLKEINDGVWQKVFHPEDVENVALTWQQALQNKTEYFGEYRIRNREGTYYWFMGRTTPIQNKEGKIIKWIGTSTNIDEQKKVQDALQKSEEQFRELADSMPQIVWTARPDGKLDYYNKKWYEFTGFEQGMEPDAARDQILHPDDVEFCRETWYNSVKTGKHYHIEYRFKNRKKPGTFCWYLGKALPIYDSNGKIVKWYGTCTDINDQKEIEALLKASEEKFRQMADSVPQHVWTAKADGGLNYVNQRAINYFGKTAEEIIGEEKFESIHPDDVPAVTESWLQSLETNDPFQVEYRLKDKNNIYRWHLGRATAYTNKYNEVIWFGTNTDIEEHKYGEQKKDEFISIASHELKTPITSLKGIVFILKEMLEETSLPRAVKLLSTMDNQLIKLNKLVTDLLDVNNIEGNQLELKREDFEFSELIKETVESVQHISPLHSIVVESHEKVKYNGDRLRLEQVITNLLTNAVKYSPGGKQVIVRYEISEENIVASVQDFGIGIEREEISKLFDRFYRVHNSLRFGGLGLGLYISANIIKAHNGNLWIESEPDRGSSFYFLLPRNKNSLTINIKTDNETYYRDEHVSINYDKENKWIEANWKGFQNLESVQQGCKMMLDLLTKNNCAKVLNDNTNVLGNWSEAAEWGGNIWFPQMQHAGLQYFAWIYSPGIFSQLAAEKSVNIMTGSITSQFFNDVKEAAVWLKEIN